MKRSDPSSVNLTSMSEWKLIFLLFLAGLGFRALHYFLFSNEIIPGPDQMREITLALKFASGNAAGVFDVYWAPVYPVLIGIAAFFFTGPVLPAVAVSILAGSVAVPLTYILVRQSYGRTEAAIASTIAIFYPRLINSVFSLGSENVYIVWILGAVCFAWLALTKNSLLYYAITGALLGLAYLTRPEAIGYPIFFILFAVVYNVAKRRPFIRNSLPRCAALLFCFSLLAAPYITYLHSETGEWTVSGKAKVNTIVAEAQNSTDGEDSDAVSAGDTPRDMLKYFLLNLIEAHAELPLLVPPFLLLLVGIGLFHEVWDAKRFEREIYLILFCVVTVAGYAAAVVQARYFYILLPVFFGWMARGLVQLLNWTQASWRKLSSVENTFILNRKLLLGPCILAIYLYGMPLNFYMRSKEATWKTRGYEERDAGLWLKKNGGTDPLVFSASMRPAFYAGVRQITPKTRVLADIISDMKANKIDYAVTSERSLTRNPFLKDLEAALRNDPEFELVYSRNDRPGYGISIYKFK